jgi:acetyltransferase-like isoleucine patch superfamily enzyme
MFLSKAELSRMNFNHLGKNVKISNRAALYQTENMSISDNSRIDDFCVLSGRINIGKNVHITTHCSIAAAQQQILISDFVGIAWGTTIFSSMDDFSGGSMTNPTIPIEFRGVTHAEVVLNRHVIIGANSVVFPGVEIAEGCAIGSMTLVTKSTEPWGIYVGVPARRLRDRSQNLIGLEEEYQNGLTKPPSMQVNQNVN